MAQIGKTPGNRCFQRFQPDLVFSYIAHGYIILLCINIHGVLVVGNSIITYRKIFIWLSICHSEHQIRIFPGFWKNQIDGIGSEEFWTFWKFGIAKKDGDFT
ncbi:MAG: hypothetical protein JRE58_13625 [Deltaproteobacteria bacterium]|nr:hypothetical protein [Deltaproteobacteria bacterium]